MPLNPEREPTKLETTKAQAYAHAEEVSVVGLSIALVICFTVLGAPATAAFTFLLGVALVYLIQWVKRGGRGG